MSTSANLLNKGINHVAGATAPIRVMVVDDSVVVRGLVSRWIEAAPDLEFVGKFSNGLLAVEGVIAADPDVIVLDIEMPVMSGLEALPKILKNLPTAKVIMASTLTQRNADISLKALSLGAADYCPKPVSNSGVSTSVEFQRELLQKIHAIAGPAHLRRRNKNVTPSVAEPEKTLGALTAGVRTTDQSAVQKPAQPAVSINDKLSLRRFSSVRPRILLIGSSTGGPPAVIKVLEELQPLLKYIPVLVTQHMPKTFTGIFASHIGKATGVKAHEGQDQELIMANNIYVAPGGIHMLADRDGSKPIIRLSDGPDINFCKPAVDPMFESASKVYGPASLAVVFTGMGSDGAKGAVKVADAGGSVIAQDEASSVVWGMPGATARAGACSAILPLDKISDQITRLVQGSSK